MQLFRESDALFRNSEEQSFGCVGLFEAFNRMKVKVEVAKRSWYVPQLPELISNDSAVP